MLRIILGEPRRSVLLTLRRFNSNSANNGSTSFDMLKLATQSANKDGSRLSNSYLDSQTNIRRPNNIISNSAFEEDPKVVLRHLPRTGPGMGTSVEVRNGNVKSALSQLSRLLRNEQVRETRYKQRYHLKPSKVKGEEKTKKRKEWFHAGLKQLFTSVKDAKRRGY